MITGFVQGQVLRLSAPVVAADTLDYLTAQFVFRSADWSGMEKWAHFSKGGTVYDIPLTDDKIRREDHLNLGAGEWKVYIHGNRFADGTVVERITTAEDVLRVVPTGTLDGEPFPEMPASVTEQILARLEDVEQNGGGSGGQQAQIDDTLTKPGYAADAKAVGDALAEKLDADALGDAVEDALRQAKESGEFDGTPGTSPTVAVSEIAGGHRITITDKNGTKTVDVMDGTDGDPGAPGNDYVLTDADKTEIAEIAAGMVDVPEGGGGSDETWDFYQIFTTEAETSEVIVDAGENKKFKKAKILIYTGSAGLSAAAKIKLKADTGLAFNSNNAKMGVTQSTVNTWGYPVFMLESAPGSFPVCLVSVGGTNGDTVQAVHMGGVGQNSIIAVTSNPGPWRYLKVHPDGTATFNAGVKIHVWGVTV